MAKLPDDILLALWHRALEAEIGIAVEITERRIVTNALYRVRQNANDPALDALILIQPPKADEIWICKKATELSE